jgi:hypothetical protein
MNEQPLSISDPPSRNRSIPKTIIPRILIIVFTLSLVTVSFSQPASSIAVALPDISGVAWVVGDRLMAVHDAKDPSSPRVSLLQLPNRERTLSWQVLDVDWPKPLGASQDLESITAIPETNLFLLAESGARTPYNRLFLLAYAGEKVKIIAHTTWPIPVKNVEAIAVTKLDDHYLFLYAERAEGQGSTEIRWSTLTLNPLQFGEFQAISFSSPFGSGEKIRQISDMAIDSQQHLYIASTQDLGNTGVFRSEISQIGRISAENRPILDRNPRKLGEIQGLKVEGLTIQKLATGDRLFFGTDDENYGGVFRPLPGV